MRTSLQKKCSNHQPPHLQNSKGQATTSRCRKILPSVGACSVHHRVVKKTPLRIKLANAKMQPRFKGDKDLYGRHAVGQQTASRGDRRAAVPWLGSGKRQRVLRGTATPTTQQRVLELQTGEGAPPQRVATAKQYLQSRDFLGK